jgi:Uncharacterised nucleotidyltransferase
MMHPLVETKNTAAYLIALLAESVKPAGKLTEADWERLIAIAQKQFVTPILYMRLKDRGITPPPRSAEALQQIYLASLKRNMRLFHELDNILQALQADHIPVIPFKGAYLAEAVYGNIAFRPMDDIDLWVPGTQLSRACAVMQTLGYSAYSRVDRPQALQEAFNGEMQFSKANLPLVELHWNIFIGEWIRHTTRIDEQGVWKRTMPLQGELIRQLSPEDAIIHLCVHLAVNHKFGEVGLRSLLDLEYARRKWSIDWKMVAKHAHAWRVSCATWLVLQILADLFGDPEDQLPLSNLAPSSLRQRILGRFVSSCTVLNGRDLGNGPERFLFQLALVDRLADAGLLVWRAFFPDRLWLTLRYGLQGAPAWRIWMQQLWHPLRVIIKRGV